MNAEARTVMAPDQKWFGLPVVDPSEVGMSSERLARVKPSMVPFLEEKRAPGVLTAIARRGKVVHVEASGYADVEAGVLLQPDTIFRIYSMTKPVTAVAAMMLYEEGSFFLDDPLADYLPEFTNMKVYTKEGLVEAERPITIRHLLTHMAGFTYTMIPDEPILSDMYEAAGMNEAFARLSGHTLETYVAKLAEFPLIIHPGSAWRYSEGICVLARLVEVLAGQSYGSFLRQRIFEPLKMNDTDYYVPEDKLARLARLYEQHPEYGYELTEGYGGDYAQYPPFEPGGSGLASTASDYLRFAQMLLNGGELEGARLLSPSTVKLIMSNHLGADYASLIPDSFAPYFKGVGFGFGGSVLVDAGARGEAGSNGTYGWSGWASTAFWIDPKEQLVGMYLCQLIPLPGNVLKVGDRLHQMAYQAIID